MKKLLCAVAAMVFALSPAAAACAEAGLPTINQALQQGAEGRRIEVSDRLDGYSVLNEMFEDFNGTFRVLILERKAPAKEFTAKKAFPPFSSDDGFPDDYAGVDIGEARVWLRGDLMQLLPADYRAGSLEEATYLIMAED